MRFSIIFLFLIFLALAPVYGETTVDPVAAAAQVQVNSISIDPEVLMPLDTAVVTIVLNNSGQEAVPINHALMYDKNLDILSDNYEKVGSIGAGNTLKLEYTIQAKGDTGIFYPILSLDFRGAHFLRYPFRVQVQKDPIEMSVLSKPEIFVEGKKDIVQLHIGNPRDNTVSGVTITANGTGHEITPLSYFIGALGSDDAVDIPFNITPYGNKSVQFTLEYQNGINQHNITYTLPIVLGESRKHANPVLSNVIITDEGEFFRVTGDVTNSGLETANGVEVTSAAPANPIFPYKLYAVGALKPDDFSSFEITFKADANTTEVPLQTSFKDRDGNIFSSDTKLELPHKDTITEKEQPSQLPEKTIYLIPVGLLLLVIIAIWYSRRNKA
ncbi:COG1361 S-layer family protein [Methanospirillum lacunae]|uniref:S-layer protein n=1 Tax=Methanospirillum lacunae TaxID=668570 RepID=A0A2V2NG04_9EURY|nr:hypothetical protein [Methanospirillum lacunae]PWR74243.1 hypothetical protein DK846_03585 [Methanospirillum lacunae]